MSNHLDAYIRYLEALTPETLGDLERFVAEDVRFADSFNDVRGSGRMRRVLADMFANVGPVSFEVTERAENATAAFVSWRFHGRLRGSAWSFDGVSELRFGPDGRVTSHVDRWDAARGFYEELPVIGWLLRRIRNRLQIR